MKTLLKQILDNYNARSGIGLDDEVLEAIRAEIDMPEPEPSAWLMIDNEHDKIIGSTTSRDYADEFEDHTGGSCAPLYVAPPKPEPLNEDKLKAIRLKNSFVDISADDFIKYSRAIEQAHGIGAK